MKYTEAAIIFMNTFGNARIMLISENKSTKKLILSRIVTMSQQHSNKNGEKKHTRRIEIKFSIYSNFVFDRKIAEFQNK